MTYLPTALKAIVLSSYVHGFFFVSGKEIEFAAGKRSNVSQYYRSAAQA